MSRNAELAALLQQIGDVLELKGENPFKVRAYRFAARTIEGLGEDVANLVEENRLGELPGFGEALVKKVSEWVRTGRMTYFEEVARDVPPGVLEMLRVRGLGPKRAAALWKKLNVTDLGALEAACRDGRVARLPGFGAKTAMKILEGLAFVAQARGRHLLAEARSRADALAEFLRGLPGVTAAEPAGSVRRGVELVKDLDLVAASRTPARVIEAFVAHPWVQRVELKGDTRATVTLETGMNADLRVVEPKSWVTALAYFTGSKDHNVAVRQRAIELGMKLNEYALTRRGRAVPLKTEEDLYAALGLAYFPPELREGVVLDRPIPALIEVRDLAGVFHTHSTWSDGTASIEEMAEAARALGLRYLGLSDHTKSAAYAGGLSPDRFRAQRAEIERLNRKWTDFRILQGAECDIRKDGRLDLPDRLLAELDFVIVAIHSHFEMDEETMTRRVLRALEHPRVRMLAHPTGRLLNEREGYRLDLERVLEAAAKRGIVVEINAHPTRLDLDAPHARRFVELGGRVSINPDAHSPKGLEDIRWGVIVARRAGLEARHVINTLPWEKIGWS